MAILLEDPYSFIILSTLAVEAVDLKEKQTTHLIQSHYSFRFPFLDTV